jgi:hypothetical protein
MVCIPHTELQKAGRDGSVDPNPSIPLLQRGRGHAFAAVVVLLFLVQDKVAQVWLLLSRTHSVVCMYLIVAVASALGSDGAAVFVHMHVMMSNDHMCEL